MTDYALITGSTSGIGEALAEKFAQQKINLVPVSRCEQKLNRQAEDLMQRHGIKAQIIAVELDKPHGATEVYQKVKQSNISICYLVNNAGFNERGSFLELSPDSVARLIQIHVICPTEMMKLFAPDMIEQKYGRILNLGSTGSYMACPYNSVYAATKAYALSVSKGIASELKGTGVTVTTLCPGATRTAFAKRAGASNTLLFKLFVMEPSRVAEVGFKALMRGKTYVIPGLYNKALVLSSKLVPLPLLNWSVKVMLKER